MYPWVKTKAPSMLAMDPKSWRLYAIPWSVCSVVLDFPPLLLACATIALILKRLWRSCLSLFFRTHKPCAGEEKLTSTHNSRPPPNVGRRRRYVLARGGREMEWNTTWEDPLTSYVKQFDGLIGDRRTHKTFGEVVKGIIGAGSLICQQIAGQSAELSKGKKGSQRVIRLATGVSTQRSELDAEHLTRRLREVAVEQLEQAPE